MSRNRAGFTLLEVMVALVLASVVALMAYASARVSVAAAGAVDDRLRAVRGERAARQTLVDLLHNAQPRRGRGDTSFALVRDTLTFTAAGAGPLDPDYDWLVSVRPGDAGLELEARSLGRGPAARRVLHLGPAAEWSVRVLPPNGDAWLEAWPDAPALPGAVAIAWSRSADEPASPLTIGLTGAAPALAESDYLTD